MSWFLSRFSTAFQTSNHYKTMPFDNTNNGATCADMASSGIYLIKNTTSGLSYVGSAVNIHGRWRVHLSDLKNGKHHNKHLQNSFDKHGKDSFSFSIIELCGKDELVAREQYFIDTLNPEFNFCRVAGSCAGVKHSAEAKKRMKIAQAWASLTRPAWNKGLKSTDETRAKIKAARALQIMPRGRKFSEEHRKRLSLAKIGKPSWSLGKKFSEAHRLNMAASKRGKKLPLRTKEHCEKISQAKTQYWIKRKAEYERI